MTLSGKVVTVDGRETSAVSGSIETPAVGQVQPDRMTLLIEEDTSKIRVRSGKVNGDDPLVAFFYLLMRDFLPSGKVEGLVKEVLDIDGAQFSNGWLVHHAQDIVNRFNQKRKPEAR